MKCVECSNFDDCGTVRKIIRCNKTMEAASEIKRLEEIGCVDYVGGDRVGGVGLS